MAWREVLKTDRALIQDFVDVQSRVSDYYLNNITTPFMTAKFTTPSEPSFRMFIWRDVDHEINLATSHKDATTLDPICVGIGRTTDPAVAAVLLIDKLKQTMTEDGVKNLFAIYGNDTTPACLDFYNRISNGFIARGFTTNTVTNPRLNSSVVRASLP